LKIYTITFIIFLTISKLFSQNISISASNQLKAGSGYEIGGVYLHKNKKNYFDNISDFRLFLPNTAIGFRLEYANPPEFGLKFVGIRDVFVDYVKDNFNIRAGYINDLFARGLSLNLFRKRELAFDSGIEGFRIGYEGKFISGKVIGGDLNFVDPTNIFINNPITENYKIRGLNLEIRPITYLLIGGNFVHTEGFIPSPISTLDSIEANIPEIYLKSKISDFDFFISYAIKRTLQKNSSTKKGSGLYSSFSYAGEKIGLTIEYKDYRFDIVNPIKRADVFRPTRALPFQNPPTVHKEHSFTLLQRFPHVVDFNDEVGLQLDAFFSITNSTTLNTNFSLASRHFDYEKGLNPLEFNQKRLGIDWLPSLDRKRSPFWEIYFDIEHFYDDADSYVRLGLNRRSKIFYENLGFYVSDLSLRTLTLPAEIQHRWNSYLVTKLTSESQWVFEYTDDKKYYNHLVGLSGNLFSKLTVGFRYEKTTSKYEPEGRKDWFVVEFGYRFGMANSIIINYGRERGGKVCTQGICREILPYNGLRLNINTNL